MADASSAEPEMRSRRGRWGLALAMLATAVATGWVLRIHGARVALRVLAYEVRQQLGAELRVDEIAFSLLPPRATATGVALWKDGRRWAGAESVALRLAALRSLWSGTWVGDLDVVGPVLAIDDREELWRRLIASLRAGRGVSGRSEAPFVTRRVSLRAGAIAVDWSNPALHAVASDVALEVDRRGIVAPRFHVAASVRVEVARGAARLAPTAISFAGSVVPEGAVLDRFVVDGPAGTVHARMRALDGRLAGDVEASLRLDPVLALVPEAGDVRGGGRIHGTLGGTTEEVETALDVDARAVRIDHVTFSARGRLTTRGRSWTLDGARGEMLGGTVAGTAHGTLAAGIPFQTDARVERWGAAEFVALFGRRVPLNGTLSGDVRLRGLLFGDDLDGDASLALEHRAIRAEGTSSFSVRRDHASVEGALAAGGDRVRARFTVANRALGGELEGDFENLGTLRDLVELPVDGAGTIRARFAGTVDRPSFEGRVDLARLIANGVDLGVSSGPFSISPAGAESSGMQLAGGELEAAGRVGLDDRQTNDLSVTARAADLARLAGAAADRSLPAVTGRLDGSVRLQGPWRTARLSATTRVSDLTVAGEALGEASLDGRVDAGAWRIVLAARRSDDAALSIDLARAQDGTLAGEVRAKGWELSRLAWIREHRPDLEGTLEIDGALRGRPERPGGEGAVRLSRLAVAGRPLGDAAIRLKAVGAGIEVDARVLGGASVSGIVSPTAPYPFRARLDARDVDLAPLLPKRGSGIRARLSASAELSGDRGSPLRRGRARIERIELTHESRSLHNAQPIELRLESGRFDLPEAVLEGDGQRVRLVGRWAADEAALVVSVNADLSIAESFSEEIASARGAVAAEVSATRAGSEPWRYRGTLTIRDGAVDWGLLVGVTQISASLDLDDRAVRLQELTGKLGGGGFLVSGVVSLDRGWDLGWAMREASFEVPIWLDYRASGNGRLAGPLERPTLSGDIEIDQAVYDQPIEWAEFLPWFRRQTRAPVGKRELPIVVDLHLFADGGLFVDNNLVKAELRGDLRAAGGGDALTWSGSIDVVSGEFVFRRRRFTIGSGVITFRRDRPTNPDLQFHGETSISTRDAEYQIEVEVGGTADRPRIEFTADDPSLTENDVLALVTFGRTVSQLQSQGASIELGEVLKVTAGAEGGAVEKSIYSLLPIDRIEIEPSFSRGSGASEPRLSIAKDLTDRFSAVLGAGLGSERSQDVGLEYRVTRGLSLQGVWQSQTKSQAGAVAGNLKFRVPFRTLRNFSLLPAAALRAP